MTAASKEKQPVTLPEGVSLQRVAQVLLEAWEAGSHQWTGTPVQLREGSKPAPSAPVPQDAMELFRLLHERHVDYLLVGGMAMLTYIKGRNTEDVDLLLSVTALAKIPELKIEDQNDFFARGKFRSIRVDLLLTANPLFNVVEEKFATSHRFAERKVPAVTVEGLIVLKLYALPSLYRQMDMDRAALYENDIAMLIARHSPAIEPLLALVKQHVEPGDKRELEKILAECSGRADKLRQRTNS
ncbi:MAG TPA: hypothetical protein VJT54_16450 [Verrucomicrobiae bacterium]|nr:hypothetical protein [Verrucomicrobiae bacterium]